MSLFSSRKRCQRCFLEETFHKTFHNNRRSRSHVAHRLACGGGSGEPSGRRSSEPWPSRRSQHHQHPWPGWHRGHDAAGPRRTARKRAALLQPHPAGRRRGQLHGLGPRLLKRNSYLSIRKVCVGARLIHLGGSAQQPTPLSSAVAFAGFPHIQRCTLGLLSTANR